MRPHPANRRGSTALSKRANQYTAPLTPGVVSAHNASRVSRVTPRASVILERAASSP